MTRAVYLNAYARTVEVIDFNPSAGYGGLKHGGAFPCVFEALPDLLEEPCEVWSYARGTKGVPHFGVVDRFFAGEAVIFGGFKDDGTPLPCTEAIDDMRYGVRWFDDGGRTSDAIPS